MCVCVYVLVAFFTLAHNIFDYSLALFFPIIFFIFNYKQAHSNSLVQFISKSNCSHRQTKAVHNCLESFITNLFAFRFFRNTSTECLHVHRHQFGFNRTTNRPHNFHCLFTFLPVIRIRFFAIVHLSWNRGRIARIKFHLISEFVFVDSESTGFLLEMEKYTLRAYDCLLSNV